MISLIIILVGFSGIVAQTLLLRELLVTFYGSELNVGIILASWIIAEAIGVVLLGKLAKRAKSAINFLVSLQILFSCALPVSLYLARAARDILGFNFGEGQGILAAFIISFVIILPVGFSHGALFSVLYKLYSGDTDTASGRVYSFETLGTLLGGVIFTCLFIPYLNSFQIVFLISIANIIFSLILAPQTNKILRYCLFFILLAFVFTAFGQGLGKLQKASLRKAWKNQQLLDYRNSIYGNIAVTKNLEQYTFFYNGMPVITAPFPNKEFVEDFGNLPLFFHPAPKDILVLGSGAGGLINEILKHPVRSLDYVELDPLLIEMLKKYPTSLTSQELNNNRVKTINSDGIFYLKNCKKSYDLIVIGASCHEDLVTNRFFTREFFALSTKSLDDGGLLAFWLPGSKAYLSQELTNLNASVLNAVRSVYPYVRIIPGDYNIFMSSRSIDIMGVDSNLVMERKRQRSIENTIILANYLDYRLDKRSLDWFMNSLSSAKGKINRDFSPVAVFEMVKLTNKKFSSGISRFLEIAGSLSLSQIIFLIILLTAAMYIFSCRKNKGIAVIYSIATTGFFGMLASLILMFCFQVIRGYLYQSLGLLISLFMAGAAIGAMLTTTKLAAIKEKAQLFIFIESIIAVFSCFLGVLLTKFVPQAAYVSWIFLLLFFICGFLMGLEFPLGVNLYRRAKLHSNNALGVIYAADLVGACIAGVFGAVVLIPALGVIKTCIILCALKISSVFLLRAVYF